MITLPVVSIKLYNKMRLFYGKIFLLDCKEKSYNLCKTLHYCYLQKVYLKDSQRTRLYLTVAVYKTPILVLFLMMNI